MKLVESILYNLKESDIDLEQQEKDLKKQLDDLRIEFKSKEESLDIEEVRKYYMEVFSPKRDEIEDQLSSIRKQKNELNKMSRESDNDNKAKEFYTNSISEFVPEIKGMIDKDIESENKKVKESVEEYNNRLEEIKNKYNDDNISAKHLSSPEYKELYKEFLNNYYYQLYNREKSFSKANLEITKDVIGHYRTLQAKVESKIGKIQSLEHLGGYDYNVYGSNGKCKLEVIYAGGYNIQRLHTRWIIKNIEEEN